MRFTKKLLLTISVILFFMFCIPNIMPTFREYLSVKAASSIKVLNVKETCKLKVKNAKRRIVWKSSNKKVATVNSKGKVVAKRKGVTKITAKVGRKKHSCLISVENPRLNVTSKTIYTGKKINLKLYRTTQRVKWSTSKSTIATVTQSGIVTAKRAGIVTITARSGNTSYKCRITVKLNLKESNVSIVRNISNIKLESILPKKYVAVQGSCNDGKYFYVAAVTPLCNGENKYAKQETALLKIDMNTKKVVKKRSLGKIGHSNCITYNPDTNRILISGTSKYYPYVYEINTITLGIIDRHKLYKSNTQKTDDKLITNGNLCYNPKLKIYIRYTQNYFYMFDEDFNYIRRIALNKNLRLYNESTTVQSGYGDSNYIYVIQNNLTKGIYINTIAIYNYRGEYITQLDYTYKVGGLRQTTEFEGISICGNYMYISANTRNKDRKKCLSIFRINMNELKSKILLPK